MKTVFEPTKGMIPVDTSYCPGCGHGIAHRIIMECLEERGSLGNTIGVVPIGCAINAHHFMNVDMCESTHGRAPASAACTRIRSSLHIRATVTLPPSVPLRSFMRHTVARNLRLSSLIMQFTV